MAKEKCAKESQRHGDYGKKASTAHFDGGARNVARNGVRSLSPALGARSCSPFSAVKMGGPFSLRCLSPLCSPAGGAGQTQSMRVELLQCNLAGFAAQKNRLVFSLRYSIKRVAWDASSRPGYSCNTKGQRDFISTLVFVASHEARCRMAAFSIQQTRKPHQTGEP